MSKKTKKQSKSVPSAPKQEPKSLLETWREHKNLHGKRIVLFQQNDYWITCEVDALDASSILARPNVERDGALALTIPEKQLDAALKKFTSAKRDYQLVEGLPEFSSNGRPQQEKEVPVTGTKKPKKKKGLSAPVPQATEAEAVSVVPAKEQEIPPLPKCPDATEEGMLKWLKECAKQGDHPRLLSVCPLLTQASGGNPKLFTGEFLTLALRQTCEVGVKGLKKRGVKDASSKVYFRYGADGQNPLPDPNSRLKEEEAAQWAQEAQEKRRTHAVQKGPKVGKVYALAELPEGTPFEQSGRKGVVRKQFPKVQETAVKFTDRDGGKESQNWPAVTKVTVLSKKPPRSEEEALPEVTWKEDNGQYAREDSLGRVHRIIPVNGSTRGSYKLLINGEAPSELAKLGGLEECKQQSLGIERGEQARTKREPKASSNGQGKTKPPRSSLKGDRSGPFGTVPGSEAAKILGALSATFLSMKQLKEASGATGTAYSLLHRLAAEGKVLEKDNQFALKG